MTLIRRDTKAAIIGIFSQVFLHQELCVNFYSLNWPPTKVHNGEEIVRERALRLVHTKLKTNTSDLLNKEAQAQVITEVLLSRSYLKSFLQLIAEIKKVFASATVTGEEFPRLMAILNMTYLPKSTAGQVSLLPWWAAISHFEFRRRWLRWWPPWLTLTWPRTLTMPGTNSSRSYFQDFSYIFQRWGDGPIVAVCHSRSPILFGICESFLWSQGYWKGPEKYWPLVKVPSTAFAEYLISKVLPHYYLLSEIPGTDTKYVSHWDIVSITFSSNLKFHHNCPGLRFASWPLRCACTWASWTTLEKLLRMFSTDWSTTCHWWAPLH